VERRLTALLAQRYPETVTDAAGDRPEVADRPVGAARTGGSTGAP
jgi:hypothetical protein